MIAAALYFLFSKLCFFVNCLGQGAKYAYILV